MEIPLRELHSGKSRSSSSRTSIVDISTPVHVKQNECGPNYSLTSPARSDSILSTSTNYSLAREQRRRKTVKDTSFTEPKKNKQKFLDNDTSSTGNVEHASRSGTDESSTPSTGNKTNRFRHWTSQIETKEIEDVEVNQENRGRLEERRDSKNILPSRSSGWDSFDNETRRSITSSENISYRERIRDRFNTVKERAVGSLSRPQSRSHSRLRTIMMKHMGARFDELLKKEEGELNAAIKHHERERSLWMDISKRAVEDLSYKECLNFFIGANEEEDNSNKEMSPDEDETLSNSNIATEAVSGKILTSDLLELKDDWELCEFKGAELMSDRVEMEKKILFCPSSKQVCLNDKLELGLTPRNLEEEGLYVAKPSNIHSKIKNKAEHRLLMDPNGKKWFGLDGNIISTESHVSSVRMRLYDKGEEESNSITIFRPATPVNRKSGHIALTGNMNFVLDVDISLIQFSHHPLFSREHVLCQRLKELYFKYKRRAEINNLKRCEGRLDALRKTRDNLKLIIKGNDDDDDFLDYIELLNRYEDDIREVRMIRDREGLANKELISRILMTWKDLEQMREEQGYRNTDIKLHVKKKISRDIAEEKKIWETAIKKESKEIYNELRKEYDEKVATYKTKHSEWLHKQCKQEKQAEPETEDVLETSSDDGNLNDPKSVYEEINEEEPKAPEMKSLSEIRAEVAENFQKFFRSPGEPELEFTLEVMDDESYNTYDNKELERRMAVKRQNVFVKLFYNGKEVCRSRCQPLSQKFSVIVSQRFAIRILEWPESLMIELYEDSGSFSKRLIASEIFLPFPGCYTTVENSDVQKHEFSSYVSVSYNHTGVGSGGSIVPYSKGSDYNNRPIYLFTSGTIAYRIGWAENRGHILAPPEKYWNNKREEALSGLFGIRASERAFDIGKLKEWTNTSKLDPNHPQNAILFHFLQQARDNENSLSSAHYFRLDPLQSEFDFCPESEISNNLRLRLLSLRDNGELEFRGIKMVPIVEKQIHEDMLRICERKISTPKQTIDMLSDPLDGHRNWGKKYLQQLHQKVLKECRLARQVKEHQDLVSEESVPDLGTLGLTFMKWLRPKRPLRPERKERKRLTPQNLSGQDIKIIINVVRAFEVPVRKDIDSLSISGYVDIFSLVNVRPFVEVSFQGVKARTTAANGANPTWNQDLHIPLHIKNGDLSHASIQSIKDNLYIHLFDEMVVDLIDDDSQRETNIHQRFERHWLASMEIPFSTLYFNSKVEGTFKLYSPPVLLGYEREAHRRQFSGSTSQEPLLPQRDATYLSVFITVQPPLNPPDLLKEKLESNETSDIEKHLEGWKKEITDLYPRRKVKPLVMDVSGKTVCIIRFVKPLTPPCLSVDGDITAESTARYVAMIPSVTSGPGFVDIWLTADRILNLLSGGSEDHALLLCSYFLKLGLEAYVLLGSGIPHGSAAYVFVKETVNKSSSYYVWDATSGQKYNVNDSFCPLQKIYCLFNDQNIWANIQQEERPRRTRFDLSKRTDWFPAFGKNFPFPCGSVQPDSVDYRTTSRQAVDILQDKIEKRLRDNIMKWRKTKRTKWNRYCSGTLRKLLPQLEETLLNTKESQTPDHINELQHILGSYKMCGFPINMAYTDMDAVVEAVRATGVHCNENNEVEFALSVYIHPYPNNVLSVWIYVASLVRRR